MQAERANFTCYTRCKHKNYSQLIISYMVVLGCRSPITIHQFSICLIIRQRVDYRLSICAVYVLAYLCALLSSDFNYRIGRRWLR